MTNRYLLYSHDTFGLGHLRRNLLIAGRLTASIPGGAAVLIATGSPRAHSFTPPPGVDILKLPSVVKQADGTYAPRSLGLSLEATLSLRSHLLIETIRSFQPDVLLVDHAPAGVQGELVPVLEACRREFPKVRLLLGLRDIIDEAARVETQWRHEGVPQLLESTYHEIYVYGDRKVLTTADELGLSRSLGNKLRFTGYLGRTLRRSATATLQKPLFLVTAGGGGDGQGLMRAALDYLESETGDLPFRTLLVTGPFLSPRRRAEVERRVHQLPHAVECLEFTDRFEELLTQASALLSMAGYNSAVEALAAGLPTLFIPREAPRLEQKIRAERLAERCPQIQTCSLEAATPTRISTFLNEALSTRSPLATPDLDLTGLDQLATHLRRHGSPTATRLFRPPERILL